MDFLRSFALKFGIRENFSNLERTRNGKDLPEPNPENPNSGFGKIRESSGPKKKFGTSLVAKVAQFILISLDNLGLFDICLIDLL